MSTPKRKRRSPSLYIPPEFVSWLSNNYVVNQEESVPKDSIYRRYVQHCREMDIVPKKSNIFGKMLKKMFPNIRPRRLGSAGNMVAHYAGITLRQPGRPLMSTPDLSENRRSKYARHHHGATSCSSGASSPSSSFSLPTSPISSPDDEDEDDDDDLECEEEREPPDAFSPFTTRRQSGPASPSSAASQASASSCSTFPTMQHTAQPFPLSTSDSSGPFNNQFTYFQQIQPQQTQLFGQGSAYAPAATFSYSTPNHQSFLSSLTGGLRGDELGVMDDGTEDVFQLHTRVMEERETIEEDEFDGDAGLTMAAMLNFPVDDESKKYHPEDDFAHLIINDTVSPSKGMDKEHGTQQSGSKDDSVCCTTQENSAQEQEDIAMLVDSAENAKDAAEQQQGQQQQQPGATTVITHTADTSIVQTVGVNPFAVIMPTEMVMMKQGQSEEKSEGNESDSNLVPPCMRMSLEQQQQQQQQLQQQYAISLDNPHLSRLPHYKKYMCIFMRQIWMYAPISTRVMDDQTVEYYILTEEGRKEQSVRSLCVKFALYMGALYCENFADAKEFYIATRDTLSFVFDVLDLDVALVLLFLSQTAQVWYDREEADALAFNYISAALSLCQTAKAFNTETYRKCVEYEGWLALRTGPAGQPPMRLYHPPPSHYKVVGKATQPTTPVDSQSVLDDTISILINVMNTLKFFELYSHSSSSSSSSGESSSSSSAASPGASSPRPPTRVTRRNSAPPSPSASLIASQQALKQQQQQEEDPRIHKLKENMKVLQKQLELCYNTICQVEAAGGFSFEAAFRPKFWLISIVSSVHLVMGEREKGMNAALLAVKSLEKWLSLSGSLWNCNVMFDYIAESLDEVDDDVTLEFFVSLVEKQKYSAARSTQAFVENWRKILSEKRQL